MVWLQNGVKIGFLFFMTILSIKAARRHQNSVFLNKLIDVKKEAPIVVFLERSPADGQRPKSGKRQEVYQKSVEQQQYEVSEVDVKYTPSKDEQDAYALYSILRSTAQEEELTPEEAYKFEKTQSILRQAFALRCMRRDACEEKCPPPKVECEVKCEQTTKKPCKKVTCPTTPKPCQKVCEPKPSKCADKCQNTYDELDACGRPKKGRTMPPRWLRNLLDED